MTSEFVRVTWGLQHTDVFLHINIIKAYIQSFQQDRDVDQTTKMNEEIALLAQDRMEGEINQVIRTCDDLTKQELFEYLTGWIHYFNYHLNSTQIEKYIEEYNEKRLIEYNKFVESEEEKFKQTKQFKTLNHLESYEVDNSWAAARYVGGIFRYAGSAKRIEQYRKFFEAPDPDLIDTAFLPKYMHTIRPIISRCVKIAKKRLRYLEKRNEPKQLPAYEATKQVGKNGNNKTKVDELRKSIIALFCFLVNESALIPKGEDETNGNYCKRICNQYNLDYSDRVRQRFSVSDNKRNRQKIKDVILPKTDEKTNKTIIAFLNKKNQTKQKLYG